MEKAIRFGLEIAFLLGIAANLYSHTQRLRIVDIAMVPLYGHIMPDIYKKISGTRGMPVFHPKEISELTQVMTELYAIGQDQTVMCAI